MSVRREADALSMTSLFCFCERVDVDPDVFRIGFEIDFMSPTDRVRRESTWDSVGHPWPPSPKSGFRHSNSAQAGRRP